MNKIELNSLELKTFTEQDAFDYCGINNIKLDNITELYLNSNELSNIFGIKLFKNLETLWLYNNKITDISAVKDLNKLKVLELGNNQITNIFVVKYLKNLEILWLYV